MVINPKKIRAVVEYYGKVKGYPEKSYLPRFTEDHKLNYKQWAAFLSGGQDAGYKVVDVFMDIFPDMDTNWLIKDAIPVNSEMFSLEKRETMVLADAEPEEKYNREITNEQIFLKLEEIHFELKRKK